MIRDRTVVPFMHSFLWMLITQVVIAFYMFYIVPPSKDVDFVYSLRWLFDGEIDPPKNPQYILPILALLMIVIVFGNNRIRLWLLGMPILYITICIQFFIISPEPVMVNAFGIETWNGFAAADSLIAIIPFWCIFFFLWELLFCGIAKLWRRKREKAALDKKDSKME